jgi:hypothetical protein
MEAIDDQLMWPHSKDGIYTVKSGYNLLKHFLVVLTLTVKVSLGRSYGTYILSLDKKLYSRGSSKMLSL